MIKEIQIENFRCFKERTIFPLSNLNLLYGNNSSGKTTFLRAIALLKETFNQKNGLDLKLPEIPYNLGNIKSLHWNSKTIEKNTEDSLSENWIKFRIRIDNWIFSERIGNNLIGGINEIEFCFYNDSNQSFYSLDRLIFFHEGKKAFELMQDYEVGEFCLRDFDSVSQPISDYYLNLLLDSLDSDDFLKLCGKKSHPLYKKITSGDWARETILTFFRRILYFDDRGGQTLSHPWIAKINSYSDLSTSWNPNYYKSVVQSGEDWYEDFSKSFTSSLFDRFRVGFDYEGFKRKCLIFKKYNTRPLNFELIAKEALQRVTAEIVNCDISSPKNAAPKRVFFYDDYSVSGLFRKLTPRWEHDFFRKTQTSDLSLISDSIQQNINKVLDLFGYDFKIKTENAFDGEVFRILLCNSEVEEVSVEKQKTVYLRPSYFNLEDGPWGLAQLVHALIPLEHWNYNSEGTELESPLVLLEEPEVHMHPEMQIKFINYVIQKAINENVIKKQVFLDTHSEVSAYAVLDRISRSTNGELGDEQLPLTSEQVQFLKVEYLPDEKYSIVHPISAGKYGTFSPPWPGGFFKLDDLD